jgi:hypothetical protein
MDIYSVYAKGLTPIFVCARYHYNIFIEYLQSYGHSIKFKPYVWSVGEFPIFVQRIDRTSVPTDASCGLLNTEQLTKTYECTFIEKIKESFNPLPYVFDYSYGNIEILKTMGIEGIYAPYKKNPTEINQLKLLLYKTPKEYDIAFIGEGERRSHALEELRTQGFRVNQICSWGIERDKEVAKCCILLNIHFAENYKIFEEIRCRRWMLSEFPVLSEYSFCDDYLDKEPFLLRAPIEQFGQALTKILRPNPAPEHLFCAWTDSNPLSATRQAAVNTMESITETKVHFLTPDTLHHWIKPDYPLHHAYPFLSAVHKSDYLRCYLMHHYGGGWIDVKPATHSWKAQFDELNSSNAWILGYKEIGPDGIANIPDKELYRAMQTRSHTMIGCGAFLCKPYSLLTQQWMDAVHYTLDEMYDALVLHPAKHPRDHCNDIQEGLQSKYPLRWTQLMGDIFHPLVYVHNQYVKQGLPMPQCTNYL